MKNVFCLVLFSLAFCLNVQAKNFLRHLDLKNLEKYGVYKIDEKNRNFKIDANTSIKATYSRTKTNKGESAITYNVSVQEGKSNNKTNITLTNKNQCLVYITKDSRFPFNVKEPGLYNCELMLSYIDSIASTLVLDQVFPQKKYQSVTYTINEETCGFIWIEKSRTDHNIDTFSEVYDSSMKKIISLNKNSHIYFTDLQYKKDVFYIGYEGILFYVLTDDFTEELYTVEGKKIYKTKDYCGLDFVASKYEHNFQSVGFYYFNSKKDEIQLYDCDGKFVKNIPVSKHKYISEIGTYLPHKSKSFLANKKTDINKLLNRNDIYESNGRFQYLVNYDEARIHEFQNKAYAYANKRNYKNAAKYYSKAFELSKSGLDLFNRGLAYYNSGKYNLAVEDFHNCLTYSDIDEDVRDRVATLSEDAKNIIKEKAERKERMLNALAAGFTQVGQNVTSNNVTYNSYRSTPVFNYYNARTRLNNTYSNEYWKNVFKNSNASAETNTNSFQNQMKAIEEKGFEDMKEGFKTDYGREPTEEEEKQLRALVQSAIAGGISDYYQNNHSPYSTGSSSTSSSSTSSNSSDTQKRVLIEEYTCEFCGGTGECKWCYGKGVMNDVSGTRKCANCYDPIKGKCHQCQGSGKRKRLAH